MKLTGKMAEEVQKAGPGAEAKDAMRQAGMELTDEEAGNVAGGVSSLLDCTEYEGKMVTADPFLCPYCSERQDGFDHGGVHHIDGFTIEEIMCSYCFKTYVWIHL